MHENRETSETPAGNCRRSAGEGPGHTARVYVTEESHCGIVPMNHSNKDGTLVGGEWGGKAADQGEHFSIWHVPDSERDVYVSHGWASVRTSCSLGRYSSEIRTGCANERP